MKRAKLILSVLVFMAFGLLSNAQSQNDYIELAREVLKMEKKAAIAEVMMLSEAESAGFWTLYNEYQNALHTMHSRQIEVIKDYANNYASMTDEKAEGMFKNYNAYQSDLAKLKKKYYKKFKKVVSPSKAAMYFQAENKIEALINAELALEIPLLEGK